jgi:pilus assembly protein CpaB
MPVLAFRRSALEHPAVLLPVALLLVAVSAGLIWSNLAARRMPAAAPPATRPVTAVVVSTADIPRGRILTARDFAVRFLDASRAPLGALSRPQDAEGHMALAPVKAGEPILASAIGAETAKGLSPRVPEGYRAYSIAVSEAGIAGGFLQPGDRVDLYVTLPGALMMERAGAGRPGDRSRSVPLLQAVRVLAVGGSLEADSSANPSVRTVTLALNAADLARVALASRLGTITFAIRNPVDAGMQAALPANLASLLGDDGTAERERHASRGIPMLSGRDRLIAVHP